MEASEMEMHIRLCAVEKAVHMLAERQFGPGHGFVRLGDDAVKAHYEREKEEAERAKEEEAKADSRD